MATNTAELKKRANKAQKVLEKLFPDVTTALKYKTPFQLLVATIMSAQCTDVLVNKVTPGLFKKYKTPKAFAESDLEELRKDIYPVTFYKNKAKMIQKAAQIIIAEHKGQVPKSTEELIKLPGVARKTANVVLGHAYGIPSGFVVDTHVIRVSNRLGLTESSEPKQIEKDLMALVPQKNWVKFADQLIWYGRTYCTARKDKCSEAGIKLEHFL